ncbi:hypothetical protein BC833DRAFT_275237 [Globomyces pollinis-pini]|nr:hypothetical protein BC833DRAFT_275237 [Globomyces pollinis-pini]
MKLTFIPMEQLDLSDYTDFEVLSENQQTGIIVQRARKVSTNSSVIIKALSYFSEESNAYLQHEYDMLRKLSKSYDPNFVKQTGNRLLPNKSGNGHLPSLGKPISRELRVCDNVLDTINLPEYLPIPKIIDMELMQEDNSTVLIYEDIGGECLQNLTISAIETITDDKSSRLKDIKSLTNEELLIVFAQLANALHLCHSNKIIHLNVNPSNIVVKKLGDSSSIQTILIDFKASERFEDNAQKSFVMRYNYAYISPEQTGRTDRLIDYRSDFYSLGITMWEMFVGELPFNYSDPAEMVYAHLAKELPDPKSVNPNIPEPIAAIIMKLVKKDPSDRYQLALAITHDVCQCLTQVLELKKRMSITGPLSVDLFQQAFHGWVWSVGEKDYSTTICFSSKPYGRKKELNQLIACYQSWDSTPKAERKGIIVCLSGAVGCGKASFAYHLSNFTYGLGAYTVTAKFSLTDFAVPYVGMKSILEQLVSLLLSETPTVLQVWEEKLINHVGLEKLAILSILVPTISHVVPQIDVDKDNEYIQNNVIELYKSVQLFLELFATPEHPLIISIDSLQAGPGTLDLLVYLLNSSLASCCFFFGYCDLGEDKAAGRTNLSCNDVCDKLKFHVFHVFMRALDCFEIAEFLDDSLRPCAHDTMPLAALFLKRTNGNYALLREIIKFAAERDLIRFDSNVLAWTWDIKPLEKDTEITLSAAEFVMKRFQELDATIKDYLRLAACVGLNFDLRLLSSVLDVPTPQLIASLAPAVAGGYIIPCQNQQQINKNVDLVSSIVEKRSTNLVENSYSSGILNEQAQLYQFCHDRIHNVILDQVPASELQKNSLSIARFQYKSISEGKLTDILSEVLRRYNDALSLIIDENELFTVADLNYKSALRVSSDQFDIALKQLNTALDIIRKLDVTKEHVADLLFHVYCLQVTVYNREEMVEKADSTLHLLQKMAGDDLKQSKITSLTIQLLVNQSKADEAIQLANNCQNGFGELFRTLSFNLKNGIEFLKRIELEMGSKSVTDILNFEQPHNELIQMLDVMIYNCMTTCNKKGDKKNATYFYMMGCLLSLKYGFAEYSNQYFACVISNFAGVEFEYFDYKRAQFIGQIVLSSKNPRPSSIQAMLFGYSLFWSYFETSEKILTVVKHAMEEQSTRLACSSMLQLLITTMLPYGKSFTAIKELDKKFKGYIDFSNGDREVWDIVFNEYEAISSGNPVCHVPMDVLSLPLIKQFVCYIRLLGSMIYNRDDCRERLSQCHAISNSFHGTWVYVDILVCSVILKAQDYTQLKSELDKSLLMEQIDAELTKIKTQTSVQPSAEHTLKYHFAAAAKESGLGNTLLAIENYETALELANRVGNLLFSAWISEAYGNFWLKQKSKRISNTLISSSILLYGQWGCEGKSADLIANHPEFKVRDSLLGLRKNSTRKSRLATEGMSENDFTSTLEVFKNHGISRKMVDIDINTVLKVTNSITNETNLEALVDKILGHLMNNTGASRAVFFINDKGALRLEKILNSEGIEPFDSTQPESFAPMSLVNFVFRTQDSKVYSDIPTDPNIANDVYIDATRPKSILCCPIKHQNLITGIVYLENRLQPGSFTATRVNLVKSLMASASISIANAQLLNTNQELAQQLKNSTQSGTTGPKYNVETPMQKALDAIISLKTRFQPNDPIIKTFDIVLSTLMSDGLFSANLGEVNDKDGVGIDQDTKNWIESSLLMTKNQKDLEKKSVSMVHRRIHSRSNIDLESQANIAFSSLNQLDMAEINTELEKSSTYTFDCFRLAQMTKGAPLYFLTSHLLRKYSLNETFSLNPILTQNFLEKIESSYNKLPYHNSIHATDVLQSVELLLLNTEIGMNFSPMEIFSICIASAVHDLDHPGINNNFLVQINHPLSVMYNDIAILESHHVARAFEIAKLPGMNIFESMSPDQFRQSRKMIISIVLATGKFNVLFNHY